jgi:hypothetical protein
VQDRCKRGFDISLGVGVVDAEQKLPAVLTCEEPIEERGPNSANVQITGLARCETCANCHYQKLAKMCRNDAKAKPYYDTNSLVK